MRGMDERPTYTWRRNDMARWYVEKSAEFHSAACHQDLPTEAKRLEGIADELKEMASGCCA